MSIPKTTITKPGKPMKVINLKVQKLGEDPFDFPIKAHVFGKLAVHRPIGGNEVGVIKKGFRITHIPTGFQAFPREFKKKEFAVGMVKQLLGLSDWNFTSPKSKKVKELAPKVKNLAQNISPDFVF